MHDNDEYFSQPNLAALPDDVCITPQLIVMGISAGGPDTLCELLPQLKAALPPIMLVQHMPEKFTAGLAERLNGLSALQVIEAVDDMLLENGTLHIAPGGKHLSVVRKLGKFYTSVADGELVCGHKPAVEVLYQSAAKIAGKQTWGIILTGMGHDGDTGMKALFDAGAHTIAQSADSCFIFGMPKRAIRAGGVHEILSLAQIAERLNGI